MLNDMSSLDRRVIRITLNNYMSHQHGSILQFLSKACTALHNEPLDYMLNVIHNIGYGSSGTAWIIDSMHVL